MRLKRLKCGETSCLYHDGGCTAGFINVAQYDLPYCVTYREYKPEKQDTAGKTAPPPVGRSARTAGKDETTGYVNRYLSMEAAQMEPAQTDSDEQEGRPQRRRSAIECDAINCHYNHDNACWSPFVEIGYPRQGSEVDTGCRTHVYSK